MNKRTIYRLSQNIISLFAVKGIDLVLTLFLIPFLIVKVGIHNYGIYAFAMSLMLFFVNVLNYGFDLSAVRELAIHKDDPSKVAEIVNMVISVKFCLIIIIYVIIIGLILLVPIFFENRIMYVFSSLLLVGDLFSVRWFFLGLEKMKFISIMSTVSTIIYVLVVLFLIKFQSDFIYIPIAEAIGMFLVSFISFLWVLNKYEIKFKLLPFSKITIYLKANFSSFINLLLPSTYGLTTIFLVGVFGVPYDVTIIQIGMKFTSAFSTVNTIMSTVFYPMVNRDKKNMRPTRLVLLCLGFVLSICMFFGSHFLIVNWLKLESSTDLKYTIQLIKILSPIPFLMGVISSYGVNGILVYFKDKLYSKITVSTTLLMVGFAAYLVPKYHFFGGGIAFLFGRLLYAILLFMAFYVTNERLHKIN
ncbi:oligosaccharide flippase family protein [Flavobacterium faecale]|uniref:oligosaccharide flippase family protein n=1 Tax=Flavobacterium faecale TaxID=1355330 RepID=UPI003AB06B47